MPTLTLTLAIMDGLGPTTEDLNRMFFFPLSEFVKANQLGVFDKVDERDLDQGNVAEWCIYSPTDDYDNVDFSAVVNVRIDGVAQVWNRDRKTILQDQWTEAAKWILKFYAEVGKQRQDTRKQLGKLYAALAFLGETYAA